MNVLTLGLFVPPDEFIFPLMRLGLSRSLIEYIAWPLVQIAVMLTIVMTVVAYLTLAERKISAWMQVRVGPNRVGPWGILQPLADGLKLILKEDIIPLGADHAMFSLAPVLSMVAALTVLVLLPYGPLFASITDVNIGLLFIFSFSSIGILGLILGGWASNSKYPLLGALRSSAQMISYEVVLATSIIGALMFTRTLSMQGIVEAQKATGIWLALFQLPAFVIYLFSAIAETNRAPFDLPEAESELVGGFHTEYSGFRFSIFFIAEYANMVVVSAIAATVFLGGWYLPLGDTLSAWVEARPTIQVALGVFVFAAKVGAVLYLFFWLRWTFPRYRYDQLMDIGWKWMLPAALANVMLTAVVFVVGQQFGLVQRSGLFLHVSPVGKLYFVGASLLSMIPILILLNIINRDTRMFNLRAQRTKIPFSTRYARPAESKPAPASEAESGA